MFNHIMFECPPTIHIWTLSNIPMNSRIFPIQLVLYLNTCLIDQLMNFFPMQSVFGELDYILNIINLFGFFGIFERNEIRKSLMILIRTS